MDYDLDTSDRAGTLQDRQELSKKQGAYAMNKISWINHRISDTGATGAELHSNLKIDGELGEFPAVLSCIFHFETDETPTDVTRNKAFVFVEHPTKREGSDEQAERHQSSFPRDYSQTQSRTLDESFQ
jgi:hypothetical protein